MYVFYLQTMDQMIESLILAGVDREKIDRARRRGIAYQCLRCLNRDGTKLLNIRCRIEDHIMRVHLGRDELPYFCKLCGFRCQKRDQLISHVSGYSKHVLLAAKEKVIDHGPYLVENARPHTFGTSDYQALSPEASLIHWLGYSGGETSEGVAAQSLPVTGCHVDKVMQQPAPTQSVAPSMPPPAATQMMSPTPPTQMAPCPNPMHQQMVMQQRNAAPVVSVASTPTYAVNQLAQHQTRMQTAKNLTQQLSSPGHPGAAMLAPAPMNQVSGCVQGQVGTPNQKSMLDQVTQLVTPILDQMSASQQLTTLLQGIAAIVVPNPQIAKPEQAQEQGQADFPKQNISTEASTSGASCCGIEDAEVEHGYGLEETEAPVYIPTTIPKPDGASRDISQVAEDVLDLEDEDMSFASPAPSKRSLEEDDKPPQPSKKSREEQPVLPVDADELSRKTLIDLVGKSIERSDRQFEQSEKILKALRDSTHVLSQLVDVTTRLTRSMEDHIAEDRKREEREVARERTMEEAHRRELQKRREEEKKMDDRRREWERRDRQEQREREQEKREQREKEDKEKKDRRDRDDSKKRESRDEKRGRDEKENKSKDDRRDRDEKENRSRDEGEHKGRSEKGSRDGDERKVIRRSESRESEGKPMTDLRRVLSEKNNDDKKK